MSNTFADPHAEDKEIIRERIRCGTKVYKEEASKKDSERSAAKMAVLERQIAADQKVLADLIIAEKNYQLEVRKLECERLSIDVEQDRVNADIVKAQNENKRAKMEWVRGIIQIAVMAITSVLAVALPVWFDYYKEGRIGDRFLLSQKTEETKPYLTVTEKEVVRQGLQDTTGNSRKSILPWK